MGNGRIMKLKSERKRGFFHPLPTEEGVTRKRDG